MSRGFTITPEMRARGAIMAANCAEWGVDDDGNAFSEWNGDRETVTVAAKSKSGWLDPMIEAHQQAHGALEARVGHKLYWRYHKSHPWCG